MQDIVTTLNAIVDEYFSKLRSLSEKELSLKPAPDKWSKKEIIGHLIDSAQNNIRRFVTAQYQATSHIVYDQNVWVSVQNYLHYNSRDLIILWQLLNKHICVVLKNIPVEKYKQLCNTGKEKDEFYTIEFLAKDYIAHQLHHLKQIV